MVPPPRLTARERDCLPLLVSGKTRHEMASELDVSVETIIKHVRNLLNKYDAVNIRDALPAMRLHQEYYFNTPAIFDVFCNLAKFSVVIDVDKTEINAKICHHFTAISPVVSRLQFSCVTDDFCVTDVENDGLHPKPLLNRAGRAIFETPVVPAATQGTQFTRNVRDTRKMPAPYSGGHYAALCMYPCERLEMDFVFRATRPPNHIDATVYLHSQQIQDNRIDVTQSSHRLYMIANDPGYPKSYVVNWSW